MTSIVAPKLDEGTLPATPAHEWANETSSKLADTSANTVTSVVDRPPMVAADSTPGVPGSYPRGGAVAESTAGGAGIIEMAKQYLPGQEDVQGVLKQATETAKTYLPPAVAAYLPGGVNPPATLPSQEGSQKPMEHSDGVGSLPGNASETSVAKLPGEKEAIGIAGNSVVHDATDLDPPKVRNIAELTPATSGKQTDDVSTASIEAQPPETPATLTPGISSNTSTSTRPIGGVGDLPGSKSESTVALLPDERNETSQSNRPINLSGRLHPLAAEGVEWEGIQLGRQSETKMDADMDRRLTGANQTTTNSQTAPAHVEEPSANAGHPQPDIPSAPANGSKFAETSGHKKSLSQDLSSTTSVGSDGSRSVGGTPRKPKLMDKLKGEMKIISGKLGGKEDKVEEGRRLMGKV